MINFLCVINSSQFYYSSFIYFLCYSYTVGDYIDNDPHASHNIQSPNAYDSDEHSIFRYNLPYIDFFQAGND